MAKIQKLLKQPRAVIISDVHYNLKNLEVADAAMRQAIAKANELDVDFIVAGDLTDNKANMRAEVTNRILDTFNNLISVASIIPGNHDRINEKDDTTHALNFLHEAGHWVLNEKTHRLGFYFIPYQSNPDTAREYLATIPKGSTIIMHQGLNKANAGEYIQDKSAINPEDAVGLHIISGHYHTRQTILLPDGGTWNYIGNPYTVSFNEVYDPPKGYQVLYEDGSLEFIPTNLRKHNIINMTCDKSGCWEVAGQNQYSPIITTDILWVKISGVKEYVNNVTKNDIRNACDIPCEDFKLTLHPLDTVTKLPQEQVTSQPELLDTLIDSLSNVSDDQKIRVKALWKDL